MIIGSKATEESSWYPVSSLHTIKSVHIILTPSPHVEVAIAWGQVIYGDADKPPSQKVYDIIHPERRNLTAIRGYKRIGGLPDDPRTDPQDRSWYGPHDRLFTEEEDEEMTFQHGPKHGACSLHFTPIILTPQRLSSSLIPSSHHANYPPSPTRITSGFCLKRVIYWLCRTVLIP